VYQITLAARRAINPNAALTVLDGVTTVSPAFYQIAYGSGKIVFANYTPVGSITVTGSFLTLTKAAQGTDWSLDLSPTYEENQVFGDAWKSRAVVKREGTVTFSRFYDDNYFVLNSDKFFVLDLYANFSSNVRWRLGASLSGVTINTSENEIIKENVQFSSIGIIDY